MKKDWRGDIPTSVPHHALQLLPDSPDFTLYAGDGSGDYRPCLELGRNRRFDLVEKHFSNISQYLTGGEALPLAVFCRYRQTPGPARTALNGVMVAIGGNCLADCGLFHCRSHIDQLAGKPEHPPFNQNGGVVNVRREHHRHVVTRLKRPK